MQSSSEGTGSPARVLRVAVVGSGRPVHCRGPGQAGRAAAVTGRGRAWTCLTGCRRRTALSATGWRRTTSRSSRSRTTCAASLSRPASRSSAASHFGTDVTRRGPARQLRRRGVRDRRDARPAARHPRRGPAGQLRGDRLRQLVLRPSRRRHRRVHPGRGVRRGHRGRQRRGRRGPHPGQVDPASSRRPTSPSR